MDRLGNGEPLAAPAKGVESGGCRCRNAGPRSLARSEAYLSSDRLRIRPIRAGQCREHPHGSHFRAEAPRSRRSSPRLPQATRRSTPLMSRRATSASIRSAPAPSNSSVRGDRAFDAVEIRRPVSNNRRCGQAAGDQGRSAQHPELSRSGDHPDRSAEGDRDRRRARTGRDRKLGSPSSPARTTRSASTTPAAASTTPTSNSSRITAAARSATIPAIATPSWRSGSSSSRRQPTTTSAGTLSGTSTSNCRKTARARSSTTPAPPPACSHRSKG